MESIQVLCTQRFTDDLLERLRSVSPRLRIVQETCHNNSEVMDALSRHPGTKVLYSFFVPANAVELAPELRWIQVHSAGVDHIVHIPDFEGDVAITTASGIHATPIAEYVFAAILAQRWRVPLWARDQRGHTWPAGRWALFSRAELRDSTLGIVGYGSIGREVGRLAKSFGMRVLALRRSAGRADHGYAIDQIGDSEGAIPERFYQTEALHEMLPECDYVVLALPLTPETHHFIGETELRAMKPSAFLVNIARGALVDETALVRALREGWIAGAGLDVFEQEPLPDESPLWDLDNVLLTPHVAGFSSRYDERSVALFACNLERFLAGETLLNLVDGKKGY